MNPVLFYALLAAWGMLLGAVFFGGLWLTVRRGLPSNSPAIWFAASLLIRIGVVLYGFYLSINAAAEVLDFDQGMIASYPLPNIVATLGGFLVSRFLILRYTKPGVS